MSSDNPVERQNQIRKLFEILIEKDPVEWPGLLDEYCRDDWEKRQQIELLLQRAVSSQSYLETLREKVIQPSLRRLVEDPSRLDVWLNHNPIQDVDKPTELVGQTISHFEISEFLGAGGMGRVYLARDLNLERTVVLKFLPPFLYADKDCKKRFLHEAKTACTLDHPNIATIHEIDETGDRQLFIAMGYYPGETLKEIIARGPLPLEVALDYVIQLTEAIVHAHNNGIIHRDIKPGNVIVGEDGQLRLIDFGLAELAGTGGVVKSTRLSGTVAYMSPEQVCVGKVDLRTDIWSLGIVLYEMLTGNRPFEGDSLQEVFQAITKEDPFQRSSVSNKTKPVPEPLIRIIRICLAKSPENRYASAAELLEDLQQVSEEMHQRMEHDRVIPTTWPFSGLIFLLILLATSTPVVFWMLSMSRETGPAEQGFSGFTRIEEGALVQEPGGFGGLAWGDYDGDGWVDLVVCGLTPRLYRNLGGGAFKQVQSGTLVDQLTSENCSPFGAFWADFENDGDLDLYVTDLKKGYVPDNQTYIDDTLDQFFLNDGSGSFTKMAADWLLPGPAVSASWGDIDNDGLIDLFVSHFDGRDIIFHHRPDGSMIPIPIADTGKSFGSTFSDVDLDGDLDLIIANRPNMIFRNDGNLKFTELSPERISGAPVSKTWSFGVATGDYDNDGDLDLAVTDHAFDRIFRNDRENGWTLIEIGPSSLGSCSWGDYDNDGWLDLLISQGRRLYHNEGDGTFSMVTGNPGSEETGENKSGGWADFDNDGDLDFVLGDGIRWGGTLTDPPRTLAVYRNDGTVNNWLVLTLEGTRSNRAAIGAKVFLSAMIKGELVEQLREISGGSGHSCQNDLRVHFGLGNADIVDQLRIEWPSGHVDYLTNVSPNQFLLIKEGTEPL